MSPRLLILALMCGAAAGVFAQPIGPNFPPEVLPRVRAYLSLTDSQLTGIVRLRTDNGLWNAQKLERLAQVQREIAEWTAKPDLDVIALGERYVEVEAICREIAAKRRELQKRAEALLTDAQRVKLKALEEAQALVPVIMEAQFLDLMGDPQVFASGVAVSFSYTTGDRFNRTDGTVLGYGTSVNGTCPGVTGVRWFDTPNFIVRSATPR